MTQPTDTDLRSGPPSDHSSDRSSNRSSNLGCAPGSKPASAADTSRFFQRWRNADSARPQQIAGLVGLSLQKTDFAHLLENELATGMPLPRAMRRLRNLLLCALIARDLDGHADLAEVVDTMTGFADFAIRTHLAAAHAEGVAAHGTPVGAESGLPQEMIVLGMGKLGGGELNVSSDIDLIFVYPEDGETRCDAPGQRQLSNHEFFARIGKKFIAALSEITEDGFTFRVDMALRPNGKSGPLAASLNMVEEYLIVQGREWERYAWVKARAITGRADDIAALHAIMRPFVYRRYLDFGAIDAMRNMHGQIRTEVIRQERLHPDRSNNVKLGRGGIREIEFLAQVFQLIRGGREQALRVLPTRQALRVAAELGLLAPEVVEQLLECYTFLRNLEHRLQYLDDAQTHTLPAKPEDCLLVAKMMGYADVPTLMAQLEARRCQVAAQFDAMFRERGNSGGASGGSGGGGAGGGRDGTHRQDRQDGGPDDPDEPVIDPDWRGGLPDSDNQEAMVVRLAALGFADAPAAAQRLLATWQSPRLQALPEASRKRLVALVNAAFPLVAQSQPAPQATLGRLLDFLEAIARRSAYLSLLTEYPQTLQRVVKMMAASNWAATFLTRHPLLLDEMLEDTTCVLQPDWPEVEAELERKLGAAEGDTERQMDILREVHHAQLFHLLAVDLAGGLQVERLADFLSELADVMVAATVRAVWRTLPNRHRETPKFAVIAYGKLGGKELGYVSDLDVIFLYDDEDQEAPLHYGKLAQRFITWMTSHTPAGILFDIDTALRPDGASGMLVSRLSAFGRYQSESAWVWEHQALTRARFCAGDREIGAKFEQIREAMLRRERDREALKREVLSMRQKMHAAQKAHPGMFDLKQDAGGMIDIEFMVQYMVLGHAAQHAALTGNIGNIALLQLCGTLGLVDAGLAGEVAAAYRVLRRLQHQMRLQGDEKARVPQEWVEREVVVVKRMWAEVFGG